jgi:uncharacterized protein (TIGR02453 family)
MKEIFEEPFLGFTEDSINFLKKLKNPKFNNRDWFNENREIYEVYLKQPMRSLINILTSELREIDEDILVNYRSIFRINRDIRFSNDKTPYKSHYAASFCFNAIKRADIPQFYFHFSPDEFLIAGGQYSPDKDKLKLIRNYIFNNFDTLLDIISDKDFVKEYKEIHGESISRLPKEFESKKNEINDKTLIKLLMMKQFYVEKTYKPDVVFDSELVGLIKHHIKVMHDFVKFLDKAVK